MLSSQIAVRDNTAWFICSCIFITNHQWLIAACSSDPATLTSPGEITSPNFPQSYPNRALCNWNISAPAGKVSKSPSFMFVSLLFCILATSTVILGRVLTCDSPHSWWLYYAAPLGDHATSTMSWYTTQSHYPDTEPRSPCPILIIPSAWLGSDKYQLLSHWFD